MFINNKKLGRFWKNEKNNTTDKIEKIIRDYSLALDPCGLCKNKYSTGDRNVCNHCQFAQKLKNKIMFNEADSVITGSAFFVSACLY